MGTWGIESFENDDAMDWVAELQADGIRATGTAIQAVLDAAPEYLEAPTCMLGLAAAEVVAALRGRPAKSLPPEVQSWVNVVAAKSGTHPGDELAQNARRAVELIVADSELLELWTESGELDQWQRSVADLRARLL